MERTTKQFTISLPPDLAEEVTAVAKAESRTISELFREAFRNYRAGRVAHCSMLLNRPGDENATWDIRRTMWNA